MTNSNFSEVFKKAMADFNEKCPFPSKTVDFFIGEKLTVTCTAYGDDFEIILPDIMAESSTPGAESTAGLLKVQHIILEKYTDVPKDVISILMEKKQDIVASIVDTVFDLRKQFEKTRLLYLSQKADENVIKAQQQINEAEAIKNQQQEK